MKSTRIKMFMKNALTLTVGCIVYAIGLGLFLDPNELCPAGVSGLALVVNHWIEYFHGSTPLTTGAIIALLNVPIMILGVWRLGWRFFFSTIVATFASSALIDLLQALFPPFTTEPLLASVLGGAFMSFGMGMVFRAGATTGGTDVIVRVLRTKYKHIKTGQLFWVIDGAVVIVFSLSMHSIETFLYAIITLAVQTFVIDAVLYGTDSAKLLYIVSDKHEEISRHLLEKLDTGVTLMQATGAYTGKDKQVVMCVIKKQLLPRVREFVCQTDPSAFMIVTKATEIFGEGYKAHTADEL